MKQFEVFKNEEFGEITVFNENGEPWFIGKEIAEKLGYSNSRKTIGDHVDNEDKGVTKRYTLGGTQNVTVINESGLYSLILGSKLESAKRFKRWITAEVLPSIRKNGGYIANQENLTDDELMAKALVVAKRQIDERNKKIAMQNEKIEEMKPKAIFADSVASSNTSILVRDMAKLLKQSGVEIGEKRFFKWLRDYGYLIKTGSDYNTPTQKSMELGLFEIKETVINHSDGYPTIHKTPKVTGKGQVYFINKFKNC